MDTSIIEEPAALGQRVEDYLPEGLRSSFSTEVPRVFRAPVCIRCGHSLVEPIGQFCVTCASIEIDRERYDEQLRPEYESLVRTAPTPVLDCDAINGRQPGEPHFESGRRLEVVVKLRDVQVRRMIHSRRSSSGTASRRREIAGFSRKSGRRLVATARNVDGLSKMITLTYPAVYPKDGAMVKRHWSAMRHWLIRRGVRGLWFLEFQKRGAPHYHIYVDRRIPKDKLKEAWNRIVRADLDTGEHHMKMGARIETLRVPHALSVYALKYASKCDQKETPEEYRNVGRFWGTFGGCEVVERVRVSGEAAGRLAQVARVVKRAAAAKRRELVRQGRARARAFRDNGITGFTAWDVSNVVERYIREAGLDLNDRPEEHSTEVL